METHITARYLPFLFIFSLLFISPLYTNTLLAQDFMDVSAAKGITGHCGSCEHGAGVSFVDFNNDGYDDLTFATEAGQNLVFYQYDPGTQVFNQIFAPVNNSDTKKQILWVDFDNDGDRDLFVTCEYAPNRLYRNNGNFIFSDVTMTAGLPLQSDPTYGATFGDYNNDGFLDLYVANRSENGIFTNYLFKNNGNGTFTDVTAATGTSDGFNLTFCSAFLDINDDGFPDIYNSQDKIDDLNTMFKNNGDGTFDDISASSNTDLGIDAMNVGVGDFDNDGDLDIYVTNSDPGNSLLQNNGDETFTDVAIEKGVVMYRRSWGGNFFDADNDMDLDLYVSVEGIGLPDFANKMFINDIENGVFIDTILPGMTGDTSNSFSNAIGDFNNDGFPDIVVNNADFNLNQHLPFQLWQNTSSNGYNWVKVDLIGVESNREGIGSWIEIFIDGEKYVRYKHLGIAYLAQNSTTELIGLGNTTSIDTLKVRWPSGNVDIFYDVPANSKQTITESSGPLPVSLKNFKIEVSERQTFLLQWLTESETNNEGFEIQRSLDGTRFETIGWKNGFQNSSSIREYDFEDENVQKGITYYYRLQQIDFDGKSTYSKVLTAKLENGASNEAFSFFPNPANQQLVNIKINATLDTDAVFELMAVDGQLLLSESKNLTKGENILGFQINEFPSGMYIGKLMMNGELHFNRLIVQ